MTPVELAKEIAKNAQQKRLSLNLSQQSLSEKSGVSFSVIKKFERSGKISFESLLKLASTLNSLDDFISLFKGAENVSATSLDVLLKQKIRKRGRL